MEIDKFVVLSWWFHLGAHCGGYFDTALIWSSHPKLPSCFKCTDIQVKILIA
jgi:hypothetical protein